MHTYTYGILKGEDNNDIVRGHSIVVDFDDKEVVDFVKIVYSDISEEEQK